MKQSRWDRRRFLKAMGLGGLVTSMGYPLLTSSARGETVAPPKRVVFLVSSHGHVGNGFKMPIPASSPDHVAYRTLNELPREEFSQTLDPLYPMRRQISVIEGLAHTSVLGEFAHKTEGMDYNNHTLSYAHLLTNAYAMQPGGGAKCRGGGPSIDQLLGTRTAGPGRFDALTWDLEQQVSLRYGREYSYTGSGTPTPYESNPADAFTDLTGLYVPPVTEIDRNELVRVSKLSALNLARQGYEDLIPRLGVEGRAKLEQHRDLIADLERSRSVGGTHLCNPEFESNGHVTEQFLRLATMALSCDLTRVITLAMPILEAPDFGYDASLDVHSDLAHASVEGGSGDFSAMSEQAMIDYNRWYATRIADFLNQLASVPEEGGTLLDNTAVVWLSELANPIHQHKDVYTVVAGASSFFKHDQYVRYPQNIDAPAAPAPGEVLDDFGKFSYEKRIGKSTSHLLVSLMQWMGYEDNAFGLEEVIRQDGTSIDLRGPLSELHA